jgi:hypothetical protein
MIPLDSDSDNSDLSDRFLQIATIGSNLFGVAIFVHYIGHLIDGSISLSDVLTEVSLATAGAFLFFSTLYCLFSSGTSYKDTRLHMYSMIAQCKLRLSLVAMDVEPLTYEQNKIILGVGGGVLVLWYIVYAISKPFHIIRDLIVRVMGIVELDVEEVIKEEFKQL